MENFENHNEKPLSVKDWLITLLLMAIPLVGIIMLFVYAFSNNGNVSRQNWAKAQLLFTAIILGLVLLCFILFGSIFTAAMASRSVEY